MMSSSRSRLLAGAGVILALMAPVHTNAQSRRPGSHKAARSSATRQVPPVAPSGAMPIDLWVPLSAPVSLIAPAGSGKGLDTSPPVDRSEQITVYARRHNYDREWREDQQAAAPFYDARQSDAAQPLYATGPVWDSPEQQHVMSDAKASMGLCGALGGLITCPNQ